MMPDLPDVCRMCDEHDESRLNVEDQPSSQVLGHLHWRTPGPRRVGTDPGRFSAQSISSRGSTTTICSETQRSAMRSTKPSGTLSLSGRHWTTKTNTQGRGMRRCERSEPQSRQPRAMGRLNEEEWAIIVPQLVSWQRTTRDIC